MYAGVDWRKQYRTQAVNRMHRVVQSEYERLLDEACRYTLVGRSEFQARQLKSITGECFDSASTEVDLITVGVKLCIVRSRRNLTKSAGK
jgi:hypothetical protein